MAVPSNDGAPWLTKLDRIGKRSARDEQCVFTNLGHVIDRGSGSAAQMLHRDELVWVHVPKPHPELQVASMTALTDFTVEEAFKMIMSLGALSPEGERALPF